MDTDRRQHRRHTRPHTLGLDLPNVEGAQADPGQLRWLRIAAVAEATTLLLLVGVAVPLKHFSDWPLAVRILGPVHGFAFVAYLWLILQSLGAGLLSRSVAARLALFALIPLAGYLAAHCLAHRIPDQFNRGAGR